MTSMKTLKPVVLFGPSGSGKSTLVNKILKDFPNKFGFSISHTTRQPRQGEVDGEHYHFTTLEAMQNDIANGKFIESASFGKNMYGTSKKSVEDIMAKGQVCILDIDVQGVKQIKETDLDPWYIFIQPPSMDDLKARLLGRGTETEDSLQHRLETAKQEIEYGTTPGNADVIITNDQLDEAYLMLKTFIEENVLN